MTDATHTSGRGTGGPGTDATAALGAVRDDEVMRARAILIARIAIAVYLVELLLNLTRPRLRPNEPTLTIFERVPGASGSLQRFFSLPPAVFWAVLAGIVVGAALQVVAVRTPASSRRATVLTWATLAALLGPFALIPLTVVLSYPLVALACVPGTAFVLWVLHHCQRFTRLPLPMLLASFGWGALIVFGLSRAYSGLAFGTVNGYLGKRPEPGTGLAAVTAQLRDQYRVLDYMVLHLTVVTVLALAAGVLLVLTLFRHRVTDAVSGLVLGAAAGLGYSLVESILMIRWFGALGFVNGATGGFEYWIRQSIGLLGGHVTFGAVLGAGLGLAAQAHDRRLRLLRAGAGLLAAIGGAISTEVLSGWFAHLLGEHVRRGGVFDTLVFSPSLWLLVQVPFMVLWALLLWSGTRTRAAAARDFVTAEATDERSGPAIVLREVPFLTDPRLRLWSVAGTWRRLGSTAALALIRLQSAQLELAAARWQAHRTGAAHDPDHAQRAREEHDELRAKVVRLKARPGAGQVATP